MVFQNFRISECFFPNIILKNVLKKYVQKHFYTKIGNDVSNRLNKSLFICDDLQKLKNRSRSFRSFIFWNICRYIFRFSTICLRNDLESKQSKQLFPNKILKRFSKVILQIFFSTDCFILGWPSYMVIWCWPYLMIIWSYGHHIWGSYMMIIYNDHIWWPYMMKSYVEKTKKTHHAVRRLGG